MDLLPLLQSHDECGEHHLVGQAMIRGNLNEADLTQLLKNMAPRVKASSVGVKELTRDGAGGGGAVAERRASGTAVKSSARTSQATKPYAPYSSKWELQYSKVLDMELKVGAIKSWQYEGLTFRLSKGQYHRIDFIIGHHDRSIEIAQVKGWHPNLRAGIKGLKWAAQKYPMFTWTIKHWTGKGWDGSYVVV